MHPKSLIDGAETIVIKIGSALVCNPDDRTDYQPRHNWFNALAQDIKSLQGKGKKIILVTSGAIGQGRDLLDIPVDQKPEDIPLPLRQAASAIGQPLVFQEYAKALVAQGLKAAQILITVSNIEEERTRNNAVDTISALLDRNVIPIINENDTVATREIKFGDNDQLAIHVATMMRADLAILFSTVDGLYTADPSKDPQAEHIPVVHDIKDVEQYAGESSSSLATGGMKSKVMAAHLALNNNINVILANGRNEGCIQDLMENPNTKSTHFRAPNQKNKKDQANG